MKHHTHVILVSGQPTPNLTPMLDREIRPKEVIMAVSEDMSTRADWLDDVLKPRGIRTSRWKIDDPWDYAGMLELFLSRICDLAESDLALNVTGGTKLMAIAAFEAFMKADDRPVYYVHPEHDRLIWLHPPERPARDLENRLNLEPFFQAHGSELVSKTDAFGIREGTGDLMRALAMRVDKYRDALKILNALARSADNPGLLSDPADPGTCDRLDFESLLYEFEQQGLCEWNGRRLRFRSEEDRFFANGGWLEQYVYGVMQGLRKRFREIQDVGRGLQLRRSRGTAGATNELDVAFLADNRLYVIECKTGIFDKSERGDNALYKLETLSGQFGGLKARGMLVSYQDLPDPVKQRAATDRIEICAGTQLKTLEDRLIKWVRLESSI